MSWPAPPAPPIPRRWLIIMVKEPRLGRIKTRLAREIGNVESARFYRSVSTQLIHRLARDPRWRTVLAITPDNAVNAPFWPEHVARMPQGGGDLGARMARLIAANPYGPAVVIGSDIPGVRGTHIADAFRILGKNDVVLGPAEDGGFWLAGARRGLDLREAFHGVRWSTAHALADTVARLQRHSIGYAARLFDVDTAADHARARDFLAVNGI